MTGDLLTTAGSETATAGTRRNGHARPDGQARVNTAGPGGVAGAGWPPFDDRAEDAKILWTGLHPGTGTSRFPGIGPLGRDPSPDLSSDRSPEPSSLPPAGEWDRFVRDPAHRRDCLRAVLEWGFVRLGGVPQRPGAVTGVAGRFGFVRETNYGRIFDVVVVPAPANLAFSARSLAPHTDNPYREPVPTVQLLHCLAAAGEGGDTVLVDGFAAAVRLRERAPGDFDLLRTTPVVFAYGDATVRLRAVRPMISVDAFRRIRSVAVNDRSCVVPPMPGELRAAFDAAAARFLALLAEPGTGVTFRLAPGDCLVLDNTRVLHGRTAFSPDAGRHLQGCYADLDGLTSALALLEANDPGPGPR